MRIVICVRRRNRRKSGIIQGLLNQVYEERDGELSLEHLRDLSTEEAKQELTKYKGIGPKTASCVLMFNMKRADFPVDTHVHRVSTRLGFVRGTTREQTYAFMNATMPDEIKRDMHVLLIRHGKQICKARGPKCGECVLRDDCRFGQTLKKKKTMKKELKLSDDDEEEEEELNDDDDDEEEEEKPTNSKRRGRSTAGRGGASKKGTKKAKREVDDDDEEEDDDDEDYGESRKKRTTRGGRKAKSVGGAAAAGSIKRVAKRRRSAPASAIGDIEDAA
jgi:adenine-specific DNA glycosylase